MNKSTLFKLSYGLYIIGTKDDEKNVGCVVNTLTQSTSSPLTISVCINKDSNTNACIKKNNKFTASIISEKIEKNIIGKFGFFSSKDKDKFSDTSFKLSPSGMPYLTEGIAGYLQCEVLSFVDNHSHTIFIAEVQEAEILSDDPPMTYDYYHRIIKGKTPKSAPSFVAEDELPATTTKQIKCNVCGYIYPDSVEEFNNLSTDYKCPICFVDKTQFVTLFYNE